MLLAGMEAGLALQRTVSKTENEDVNGDVDTYRGKRKPKEMCRIELNLLIFHIYTALSYSFLTAIHCMKLQFCCSEMLFDC